MSHQTVGVAYRNSANAAQAVDTTHPLPVGGIGTAIAPDTGVTSTYMGNMQEDVIEVDLTLDTSAYADGDVLADTQAVVLMASPPAAGLRGEIVGCTVLDKSDQGQPLDLVFLDANKSLGTENSAPNISDADAAFVLAVERVSSYIDLGANQVARPDFPPIPFKVAAGTLYVGAISRGTGTYAATGIRLKIAVRIHNAGLLT